MWASAFGEIET
ncbi:hypothetical protein E2320_021969, partial [Naja naja]